MTVPEPELTSVLAFPETEPDVFRTDFTIARRSQFADHIKILFTFLEEIFIQIQQIIMPGRDQISSCTAFEPVAAGHVFGPELFKTFIIAFQVWSGLRADCCPAPIINDLVFILERIPEQLISHVCQRTFCPRLFMKPQGGVLDKGMTDTQVVAFPQLICDMMQCDTGKYITVTCIIIPPADFCGNIGPAFLPFHIHGFPLRIDPVQTVVGNHRDQRRMEFESFRCNGGVIVRKNREFCFRIFLRDTFCDFIAELQIKQRTVFGTEDVRYIIGRVEFLAVFTFAVTIAVCLTKTPGTQIGIFGKGIANHPDGFFDDCRIGHTRLPVNGKPRRARDKTFAINNRIEVGIGLSIFCRRKHFVKIMSDGKTVRRTTAKVGIPILIPFP